MDRFETRKLYTLIETIILDSIPGSLPFKAEIHLKVREAHLLAT